MGPRTDLPYTNSNGENPKLSWGTSLYENSSAGIYLSQSLGFSAAIFCSIRRIVPLNHSTHYTARDMGLYEAVEQITTSVAQYLSRNAYPAEYVYQSFCTLYGVYTFQGYGFWISCGAVDQSQYPSVFSF